MSTIIGEIFGNFAIPNTIRLLGIKSVFFGVH